MPWEKISIATNAFLLILVLGLFAGISHLREHNQGLDERLARIEKAVSAVPDRKDVESLSRDVKSIGRDVAQARTEVGEAKDQARAAAEKAAEAGKTLADDAAAAPGRAAAAAPPDENKIAEMVAKKLAEKEPATAKRSFEEGKWKPPMEELSREIGLTPEEASALTPILDDGKKKVFELAKLPRLDGSSVMDDLADAFIEASHDPQHGKERAEAVFMKLFTEKIPGREEPYIAEIIRIQKGIKDEAKKVLRPEAYTKMVQSGLDPMDVKTGYDPFAEYVQARVAH